MTNVPYRMSSKSITLMLGSAPMIIPSSHMNFERVTEALKQAIHDFDLIKSLADIPTAIALATAGKVSVFEGTVLYDGAACHNFLAQRILEHVQKSLPFAPLMAMLDRMMLNPNVEIREDLFKWLESGDMPITEDGCIIGYKYVQRDYYSSHSGNDGKVLHALHTTVSMPREQCDESRHNTCSTGLHFCSFGYLGSYNYNQRTIIVKVAPEDITAIPKDYNNQKARTCKYEVIGEIDRGVVTEDVYTGKGIVPNDGALEGVVTQPEGVEEPKQVELHKDDIKEKLSKMKFTHSGTGKTFKAYRVWNAISKEGQRGASKTLGVPRTTLQNWLAAINEAL
jgi:hypothetical protein